MDNSCRHRKTFGLHVKQSTDRLQESTSESSYCHTLKIPDTSFSPGQCEYKDRTPQINVVAATAVVFPKFWKR